MPLRQAISNTLTALSQSESVGALLARLGMLRGTSDASDSTAFTIALIALAAKLARADGTVTRDEFEAFKRIVVVPEEEEANVRRLFDLAKKDVAGFETYARQVGYILRDQPDLRRNVIEALFFVAISDGMLHEQEELFLRRVAQLVGLPPAEFGYVRSLYVRDSLTPYEILGITPAASDSDVRKRHRELVRENHPDRLMGRGLSAEFIAAAEKRLAAVNAAYDVLAKERGF